MNPIRSWFRRVYPHDGYILAVASVLLMNEGLYLAASAIPPTSWMMNHPWITFFTELAGIAHKTNLALVFLGMVAIAIYRVWIFHPVFQLEYRKWLQSTPWTARSPLPNGPLHLTLQDGVLVLGAFLLLWGLHPDIAAIRVVLAFCLAYEAALLASMALLRERRHAYSAAFGLGLVVALCSQGQAVWIALSLAVVYIDLQFGTKRTLSRIDEWGETEYDKLRDQMKARPEERKQADLMLGWPLSALRPDPKLLEISPLDGMLVSLLAGWWVNALSLFDQTIPILSIGLTTLFLLVAIGFRLGTYLAGFAPPISLLGRFATGRWIVPGYDRAYVAPLTSLAILGLCEYVVKHYDVDARITVVVMTIATLAPLLIGGPRLRQWHLTGEHRLSPLLVKAAGQIRLP